MKQGKLSCLAITEQCMGVTNGGSEGPTGPPKFGRTPNFLRSVLMNRV